MARMVITVRGQQIVLELPDDVDVQLELDKKYRPKSIHPTRHVLKNVGPSGRKLYRWLTEVIGTGRTGDIDPLIVEEQLGLVPIALGRTLAALERAGVIEIVHRRKEDRSMIVAYKVRISEVNAVQDDPQVNPFESVCNDIREVLGNKFEALFRAICREADISGLAIFQGGLRGLAFKMVPVPNNEPEEELNQLELGDWVSVISHDPLVVKVIGWGVISEDVAQDRKDREGPQETEVSSS